MTSTFEMNENQLAKAQLTHLRQEHRDMDDAISALAAQINPDLLQIQRFKRKKLALKDAIAKLEDRITPDIIA